MELALLAKVIVLLKMLAEVAVRRDMGGGKPP
jgi:hypothetical protein